MEAGRLLKISCAGAVGAFIGSSMGIAAMGSAIAGTIPIGLLAAYLMYLWTSKKSVEVRERAADLISASETSPWKEMGEAAQDTVPIIKKAANDFTPVLTQFFSACWNLLMKTLIAMRLMPLFRRWPWLHAVLIFLLMAIMPYIGVFFLIAGCVATSKAIKADNDFIIPPANKAKGEDI